MKKTPASLCSDPAALLRNQWPVCSGITGRFQRNTQPKGSQPLYYSSNTLYVRHLTEARPAEPHEVIERIAEYLQHSRAAVADFESDEKSKLYSDLAPILVEVLVFADEADERQVNPWFDMWRSEYGYAASQLRELAASQTAISEGIDSELRGTRRRT